MQNWNKMNRGKCFFAIFKMLLDVGCNKQHQATIDALTQSKHFDQNIFSDKVLHLSADADHDFPSERLSPASPKTPHRSEKELYGSGWLLIWQWRMLSHIRHLIGFGRMSIIAIIIIAIIITIIITNVGQHHHHHHSHDNHDKGLWDWNGTGKGRWRLGDGWKSEEVNILNMWIMMTKMNTYDDYGD